VRFVSQDTYSTWFRGHPKPGDILFVNKATPGRVCLVPDPVDFCIAQDMVAVRADSKKIYPRFLLAVLRSQVVQERIEQMHVGTLIPHFKKGDFDKLLIPVPSRGAQEFIGDIYYELSAKIDLNRRMNETLEAIAQAIFKSWFVDFDPVRAKRRGVWPYAPTISPDIADLFPDSFVDSELGDIPKGWGVRVLGDLLEFAYGKALKEENRRAGQIPVFGSNGQVGWHDEKLATGPGIIVGRKGNPGIVTWAPTDFFAIDTTFYVAPKAICRSLYFLFYALKTQDLASLGADSAVPGLNRNLACMSKQTVPTSGLFEIFDSMVQPLFKRIRQNGFESRTLAALRDTLLPKLISGEIRVKDAERFLKARGQ
jgi:type I restriction enzyme S subunit